MKKICLFIIVILLFGCTYFEIRNEIKPRITILDNEVGLVYNLGNLIISDTWQLSKDRIKFLNNNKDLVFTLNIIYNEENNSDVHFNYYVNGILFEKKKNVVSAKQLLAEKDSIDNFFLYKLEGDVILEKKEKEKVSHSTKKKDIVSKKKDIVSKKKDIVSKDKYYDSKYYDNDSKY